MDGNSEYIVFSDSHGRLFREIFPESQTHVFPACSAKGLGNKNSKLKVNRKILDHIHKKYTSNPLIFMFGKVDLDFVSNYKYNVDKLFDINLFIEKSVDSYINFLNTIPKKNKIYVCEPYLCHLNDANLLKVLQKEGHFRNVQNNDINIQHVMRSNVISFPERIKMYLSYNDYLKDRCEQNNFTFLAINNKFRCIDGSFEIPKRFIPEDPTEHHLSPSKGLAQLYLNGTIFHK